MPPPPSSTLFVDKLLKRCTGWSHCKRDGVGATQLLWDCDSTFIATIFALIIITNLFGVGAPSSCGAVIWACIATAVPYPPRPDPNIWGWGSQVTRVLQLLCLLRVQAQILPMCTVVVSSFKGGNRGKLHPSPVKVKLWLRFALQPLCVVPTMLSTTSMCSWAP